MRDTVGGGRRQLHRLDGLLGRLEGAIENGECSLTSALAADLSSEVPAVRAGMSIFDAQDAVFAAQAACMSTISVDRRTTRGDLFPSQPSIDDSGVDEPSVMAESEARVLTLRIKEGFASVCLLLLEAHEGRAWVALGYRTWECYVRMEFALSRSRAYELLDQGRLHRALQVAIGDDNVPPLSGRIAASLRPVLGDVIASVRKGIAQDGSDPREVAARVVRETYSLHLQSSQSQVDRALRPGVAPVPSSNDLRSGTLSTRPAELEMLVTALDCIDGMTLETLTLLSPRDLERLARLPAAARHLGELAVAWLNLTRGIQDSHDSATVVGRVEASKDRAENLAIPFVRHAGHGHRNGASAPREQRAVALASAG